MVDLIDRVYKRIGIPQHSEKELLALCPPDSPVWDKVYGRSCTLGINQVEQPGTSHRVAAYKPRNISELCAFVAAIRPGFKSMYKTFEERQPFDYGIPSIDNLIQTDEMPDSFMLYQEMAMAVLNYAGIPMGECYGIIKNIAKKRVQKVLAYKEQFTDGFIKVITEQEHRTEEEAREVAHDVWQILEDSSRYSFNCISGDSQLFGCAFTVEELYNIKNSAEYAKSIGCEDLHDQYQNIGYGKTFSMFSHSEVLTNRIIDIYNMGVRNTVVITTESGAQVCCTPDHKFPTPGGIKYASDLRPLDDLYFLQDGAAVCDTIVSIVDNKPQHVYDVEMQHPAHNFALSNGLFVCNCSHSYCVAEDSLYCAYLKTNYPLEFYECFLRILSEKGSKDRMAAVKEEAENYFGIRFPPYRFGQDNRNFVLDHNTNSIQNALPAVKNVSQKFANDLYECGQLHPKSFMFILKWLAERGYHKATVMPLIKIDYFQQFGNVVELLRIQELFDFFKEGTAKSVAKEKLSDPLLYEIVARHATGTTKAGKEAKSFTITDMDGLLGDVEQLIFSTGFKDLDMKTKMQVQQEILGYVELTTNKEEDRRKLLVMDIYPLVSKRTGEAWAYAASTRSVGSGKTSRLTIRTNVFHWTPFKKGDFIFAKQVGKERGYWYLYDYDLIPG